MDRELFFEFSQNPEEPCCDVSPHLGALKVAYPHLYVPEEPKVENTGSVYIYLACPECYERLDAVTPDDLGGEICFFVLRFAVHGRGDSHRAPNFEFAPDATSAEVVSSCKQFADAHQNCRTAQTLAEREHPKLF
jgi:hypothetical protein